ncbi:hypothetical protein B0I35DRAFT_432059 [Stachybotrys elegans]|uniref:Uncharacterized protein n=1 Tax=Stachybotrys elegans TaxID=80388 RepID=A0A8K0SSL3_9HYPO|nr:hypothetical protein B0I35DRAFT_432059 [Stachybotrys elegans]
MVVPRSFQPGTSLRREGAHLVRIVIVIQSIRGTSLSVLCLHRSKSVHAARPERSQSPGLSPHDVEEHSK